MMRSLGAMHFSFANYFTMLRLAFAEDLTDVAHANLSVAKKVQQPKPGVVREGAEEFRHLRRSHLTHILDN